MAAASSPGDGCLGAKLRAAPLGDKAVLLGGRQPQPPIPGLLSLRQRDCVPVAPERRLTHYPCASGQRLPALGVLSLQAQELLTQLLGLHSPGAKLEHPPLTA